MRYGYVRVSSRSRMTESQETHIKKHNCDRVFSERAPGDTLEGRKLKNILEMLEEGDVIVVTDVDRLSRSIRDMLKILDTVRDKKASIEIISHNITIDNNTTPHQMLTIYMLAAYAEYDICRFMGRVKNRAPKSGYKQRKYPVLTNETIVQICYLHSKGHKKINIREALKVSDWIVRQGLKYKEWFENTGIKEVLDNAIENKTCNIDHMQFDEFEYLTPQASTQA